MKEPKDPWIRFEDKWPDKAENEIIVLMHDGKYYRVVWVEDCKRERISPRSGWYFNGSIYIDYMETHELARNCYKWRPTMLCINGVREHGEDI